MQAENPRGTQSEKFKIFRQKNGQDINKQKPPHARENNDSETATNTHGKTKDKNVSVAEIYNTQPRFMTVSHQPISCFNRFFPWLHAGCPQCPRGAVPSSPFRARSKGARAARGRGHGLDPGMVGPVVKPRDRRCKWYCWAISLWISMLNQNW